ncbi:hypothetical protein DH2020_039850 [Rehmannia glutinosa]|uniref:Protein BIC1 n=1 Tax=Rehmannia glutinosa TaxID=99300 RepID=A0ABR0UWC2_REHGL
MPPKNPIIPSDPETEVPFLETESTKTPEFENPFSSGTTKDPNESNKSKSQEDSVSKSHERIVAECADSSSLPNTQTRSIKEGTSTTASTKSERTTSVEEGTSTTALTKSEGIVEDGRDRLKRHRVEVAGQVWIPEMWGQEDLLKDWIDCTAFDATIGNSGIMSGELLW